MRARARRLPLRGADLVLMAMHARWRSARLSNNALLVVECDGPVAADRLQVVLDRVLDVVPWPAARLRRPFPWGRLHWAAGRRAAHSRPPVRHLAVATRDDLHPELEAELNAAIDPRREAPLRILTVDVERDPSGCRGALVLTWFHPLMDPRGAQTFLAQLAEMDRTGIAPPPEAGPDRDPRPLRMRGRLARRSLDYMRALAPVSPVSPGTGRDAPGRHRFWQERFAERGPGGPGPREPREISWRLAVVGRAMAELWRERGLPDVPFLLPISVDLRPRGEPGPTFGNHLAFHFARFRPSDTADVPGLARTLRGQMADAVRAGQIEANAVAMEFLHYRPLSMMLRALPWTARGETFSFNCADIMDFPSTLGDLLGRRVLNAYHAPAVLPRPGIGVFFNRCAGGNNLVVSWVEGAVSEAEAARTGARVAEGMGWGWAP